MSGGPDNRLVKRPWRRGSRWYLDGKPATRRDRRSYLKARAKAASAARRDK